MKSRLRYLKRLLLCRYDSNTRRSLAARVAATGGNLTADARTAWEELLLDFNISMAQIGYPTSNGSLFLPHGSAAAALGTTIIPIVDVDDGILNFSFLLKTTE